jgi:hypothetical protein
LENIKREQPLKKFRHRWEGIIKMNLVEIGREGVNQIHLVQGMKKRQALANMAMNLQVPENAANFLTG